MAVTKIWNIKGWIGKVIVYAENPDKTTEESDVSYSGSDIQDMTDVMDFAKLDERAKEFEHWRGDGISNAIDYATQGNKTEEKRYVSALNCTPENARENMMLTKKAWQKQDGNSAYHGYQSFARGEVTPVMAHEIGIKMAEKLWGDRFEVVIATHLDKGHIHNHYVLNSVSFVDGNKYNDCTATYMKMRRESDALCREYGLSVIENPKRGKSKHYGEWQADRENRPTWRGLVKKDVDTAIRQSMTERQFWENLRKLGYEIKTGKDISVRPPGKERFVRLRRNFGDDYDIEGIRRRILAQKRPERNIITPELPPKKIYGKGSIHKAPKMTGLRALYFYYLYKMGVLPKKRKRQPNPKQVYFLFREDIRHMQNIAQETRLLVKHSIETAEQLSAYKESVSAQMIMLSTNRKRLRNKTRKITDEGELAALKSEIAELSVKIGELRREVRLCEDIEMRSVEMKDKLHRAREAEKAEKSKTKEVRKNEPFRGRR